ncbi:P2X purinoceptor 7 [Galemys pyrenaicus]|uniref:P2X purinoceptor 7 n=1 Tax=Galemys pyrenaicus TaxID=202257 RepID=A0A8J6AAQ6_GALPY|nr:P2X purinoceptor 7 [Galemys pyrenaicus]
MQPPGLGQRRGAPARVGADTASCGPFPSRPASPASDWDAEGRRPGHRGGAQIWGSLPATPPSRGPGEQDPSAGRPTQRTSRPTTPHRSEPAPPGPPPQLQTRTSGGGGESGGCRKAGVVRRRGPRPAEAARPPHPGAPPGWERHGPRRPPLGPGRSGRGGGPAGGGRAFRPGARGRFRPRADEAVVTSFPVGRARAFPPGRPGPGRSPGWGGPEGGAGLGGGAQVVEPVSERGEVVGCGPRNWRVGRLGLGTGVGGLSRTPSRKRLQWPSASSAALEPVRASARRHPLSVRSPKADDARGAGSVRLGLGHLRADRALLAAREGQAGQERLVAEDTLQSPLDLPRTRDRDRPGRLGVRAGTRVLKHPCWEMRCAQSRFPQCPRALARHRHPPCPVAGKVYRAEMTDARLRLSLSEKPADISPVFGRFRSESGTQRGPWKALTCSPHNRDLLLDTGVPNARSVVQPAAQCWEAHACRRPGLLAARTLRPDRERTAQELGFKSHCASLPGPAPILPPLEDGYRLGAAETRFLTPIPEWGGTQPRQSEPLTMPACCSCDEVFQYETSKVIRIRSTNYGTIKWFLHMLVFSYVRLAALFRCGLVRRPRSGWRRQGLRRQIQPRPCAHCQSEGQKLEIRPIVIPPRNPAAMRQSRAKEDPRQEETLWGEGLQPGDRRAKARDASPEATQEQREDGLSGLDEREEKRQSRGRARGSFAHARKRATVENAAAVSECLIRPGRGYCVIGAGAALAQPGC